jgi:oxygen-independent coproporphyrinogen-3 oxidase
VYPRDTARAVRYGAYVHIPWCRARCPYCAFTVSVRRDRPHAAYTDAVLREWDLRRAAFPASPPETVFFGGGTPSLTPPGEIARILRGLAPAPGAEVSLEANPHDLDATTIDGLRSAGVTRLSVGVQGFDARTAGVLGRRQDSRAAPAVLRHVARAGFASWSLDLIFGAPGQTREDWMRELDAARALEPPHVSLYGLTIEDGTAFAAGVARGRVRPPDDDAWHAMYADAVAALGSAGLARYEVSNFARPGHRCVHNEHYWLGRPWAGLGVGAHGWELDGTRTVNTSDVDAYLRPGDPTVSRERPVGTVLLAELLGSGLRHVDGIDTDVLAVRTGLRLRPDPALHAHGLLTARGARLLLTDAGFPLVDAVVARLLRDAVSAPPGDASGDALPPAR